MRIRIRLKKYVTNYLIKCFLELKKTKKIATKKNMELVQIYYRYQFPCIFQLLQQIFTSWILIQEGK